MAYFVSSGETERFLSVLVIATPCPLILATPIAFLGGINKASKENIIVKSGEALEKIAKSKNLLLDKTGTLTLGQPEIYKIENFSNYDEKNLLEIIYSLEQYSMHPFAKAIVKYCEKKTIKQIIPQNIKEIPGEGIVGQIKNKNYKITQGKVYGSIDLFENDKLIATIYFKDKPKKNILKILEYLSQNVETIKLLTGDTKENTTAFLKEISYPIDYTAECKPETKLSEIDKLKNSGVIVMVGDGINDAPALALADVGIVFSHGENSASTEIADVVILDNNLEKLGKIFKISKQTLSIAKQSIFTGMTLSLAGMIFALFGFLKPTQGAIFQEAIDILVILNALRASK